jgi:3-oxoacyl-[acyl-carrier protein] reductase
MNKPLSGKVAIVTAASRGIGAGIATMLCERGARVAIGYTTSKDIADALIADIKKAGGEATAFAADTSSPAACAQLVKDAIAAYGRIDILVNNAGVGGRRRIAAIDHAYFTQMFETNVLSVFMMCKEALPHMADGGRIINISSRIVFAPQGGASVYSATKGAMHALTACIAHEIADKGITVNVVAPALIETDKTKDMSAERRAEVIAETPLGRFGKPDDVAGVVAFLASDDSKWVTGRVIRCDGGML